MDLSSFLDRTVAYETLQPAVPDAIRERARRAVRTSLLSFAVVLLFAVRDGRLTELSGAAADPASSIAAWAGAHLIVHARWFVWVWGTVVALLLVSAVATRWFRQAGSIGQSAAFGAALWSWAAPAPIYLTTVVVMVWLVLSGMSRFPFGAPISP